jgi:hypothetical protein
LTAKLNAWKGLLRRHVPQARQVVKKLIAGRILFMEKREGRKRFYEFTIHVGLDRIVMGLARANMVASPNGSESYLTTDQTLLVPAA